MQSASEHHSGSVQDDKTDGFKGAEGSSLTFEMTVSGVETMLSGSAAIFTFAVFSILILVDLTLFGVGCGERGGRLDIERTLNVYWSMKSFVQCVEQDVDLVLVVELLLGYLFVL